MVTGTWADVGDTVVGTYVLSNTVKQCVHR